MIKANNGTVELTGIEPFLLSEFGTICASFIENGVADKAKLIETVEITNKYLEERKNETDKPRRNI